jgi:hypothetical protein
MSPVAERRSVGQTDPMLLAHVSPDLVDELQTGLVAIDEQELAASVPQLEIHGRCGCRQRNCGTFYTRPREDWLGQKLRQVIPLVRKLLAIDVFDGTIVCIEFLDRPDVVDFLASHSIPYEVDSPFPQRWPRGFPSR